MGGGTDWTGIGRGGGLGKNRVIEMHWVGANPLKGNGQIAKTPAEKPNETPRIRPSE